jgi:cbb3-type cytochrome oxidase subunit 1
MDRFARWFIIMSIFYLVVAAVTGIIMLENEKAMSLKFVHSHLNLLGWVSMMIYGVGYHILPRFMGRPLYSKKIGEVQFWAANIGLIVMLLFYTLNVYSPLGTYVSLSVGGGVLELVSIVLFFYNMLRTLLPAAPPVR